MQGDFSRLTFDADKDYRAVLLQQGRVLLDADWNEQAELSAERDDARSGDLFGDNGGFASRAGFAIVDTAGHRPDATPWEDLRLTSGHYYVQGVRCEARGPGGDGLIPLTDQPYLPGGPEEPKNADPHLLYLDVWTRQVTADEDPTLRESALGGPDTTTRAQTVWQVRIRPTGDSADPAAAPPNTMAASLAPGIDDPSSGITTSGGYTLLDNQLYRVQIHDPTPGHVTFLWSRENASVVAALKELNAAVGTDHDAELVVDRVGRDDALSIGPDSVVEVTSTDRELRGEPGFIATVTAPDGLRLPVKWHDPTQLPTDLAALGRVPVVRRWEEQPLAATTANTTLEGGIQVGFPGSGYHRGDYWLVPARAVQLAYGLPAVTGTIDWPADPAHPGNGLALPPHGPAHLIAPLAILVPDGGDWTLEVDVRQLVPTLNELLTFDILDGDAQEAQPGQALPRPVRVVVRNGGLPVAGASVDFEASAGTLNGQPSPQTVTTNDDGIAAVTWQLGRAGGRFQTLTAHLRRGGRDIRPAVVATGRLGLREPGTAKVTVNALLVSDLDDTVNWKYKRGGSLTDVQDIGGWMPIVLPTGCRITTLQVFCDTTAVVMPPGVPNPATAPRIDATLYRQSLDVSDVLHPHLQTDAVIDLSFGVDGTGRSGTFRPAQEPFTSTNSDQFSHFVHVHLVNAASTEMIAFQVTCQPLGSTGGGP